MSQSTRVKSFDIEVYKRIVDNINESVWMSDDKQNTIYVNRAFLMMTGYEEDEVI